MMVASVFFYSLEERGEGLKGVVTALIIERQKIEIIEGGFYRYTFPYAR